jgi:hypothetical protein
MRNTTGLVNTARSVTVMGAELAAPPAQALALSGAQLGLIADLAEASPQWGWEHPPFGAEGAAVLVAGLRARGIIVDDSLAEPLRLLLGVALHAGAAVTASVEPDGLTDRAWAFDGDVCVAAQIEDPLVHLWPTEASSIAAELADWVAGAVPGAAGEARIELRRRGAPTESVTILAGKQHEGARLIVRTGDGDPAETDYSSLVDAAAALGERVSAFVGGGA